MTKEELIEFLKENLTIEIESYETSMYGKGICTRVKILLCDEEICEDSDTARIGSSEDYY